MRFITSPSLRGSGLKYVLPPDLTPSVLSPSLRGSGLKLQHTTLYNTILYVSLFTREWIEIPLNIVVLRL